MFRYFISNLSSYALENFIVFGEICITMCNLSNVHIDYISVYVRRFIVLVFYIESERTWETQACTWMLLEP